MGSKTKIAWTQATWNPVTGCSHVSEGCRNCYAERLSLRYKYTAKPWTAQNAAENVVLHPERVDAPLHWKKPRMVFVNSMSDLFHELVPDDFIFQVFSVMRDAKQHTFQVLTKRPARMLEVVTKYYETFNHVQDVFETDIPTPFSNVWLGISCEDQRTADERIPLLLQTPAAIRFLSCEPLLGKIDLSKWIGDQYCSNCGYRGFETGDNEDERGDPNCPKCDASHWYFTDAEWHGGLDEDERDLINWVIVGGESGPHFRTMNLDWARSIRDQCAIAGVPFFFKQESAFRSETNPKLDGVEWHQFPQQP